MISWSKSFFHRENVVAYIQPQVLRHMVDYEAITPTVVYQVCGVEAMLGGPVSCIL